MSGHCDVLVVGGGMAGCAAALAAAREGVEVVLLERHGYLGGNATRAMVAPWQSFHAGLIRADGQLPAQVIGGLAQEFVDDLTAQGACLGHLVDPIGFAGSITPVDSEALKLYLPAKLAEAGVEIRLGESVTPEHLAQAAQVVDASGSAVAAEMLGAPVHTPQDPQPMSWLFTMTGVEEREIIRYQLEHPAEFVLHPAFTKIAARDEFVAVSGFFSLVQAARESGELDLPRDRLLLFGTPRRNEVLVNTTRVGAGHPQPRLEALRQIRELADWLARRVPGFGQARLGRIADGIGVREGARLDGAYTLGLADIAEGRSHADAVARGCYPIDIHSADDSLESRGVGGSGWYDIPFGCLQHPAVPNLLCAGRCLSADRSGFASARVLPAAMATGQAAGTIAAWRARNKKIDKSACLSQVSLV
jgi:glycine/D-amino acid oxidase-like deaminating enzyme